MAFLSTLLSLFAGWLLLDFWTTCVFPPPIIPYYLSRTSQVQRILTPGNSSRDPTLVARFGIGKVGATTGAVIIGISQLVMSTQLWLGRPHVRNGELPLHGALLEAGSGLLVRPL